MRRYLSDSPRAEAVLAIRHSTFRLHHVRACEKGPMSGLWHLPDLKRCPPARPYQRHGGHFRRPPCAAADRGRQRRGGRNRVGTCRVGYRRTDGTEAADRTADRSLKTSMRPAMVRMTLAAAYRR